MYHIGHVHSDLHNEGTGSYWGQNEVIFGNLVISSDESKRQRYLMEHCYWDMKIQDFESTVRLSANDILMVSPSVH